MRVNINIYSSHARISGGGGGGECSGKCPKGECPGKCRRGECPGEMSGYQKQQYLEHSAVRPSRLNNDGIIHLGVSKLRVRYL